MRGRVVLSAEGGPVGGGAVRGGGGEGVVDYSP